MVKVCLVLSIEDYNIIICFVSFKKLSELWDVVKRLVKEMFLVWDPADSAMPTITALGRLFAINCVAIQTGPSLD